MSYSNNIKKGAQSKRKPGPSAQLGTSSRARTDPKRTTGTANAVASGLDLTRVGILSDRELDWMRRLAYGEEAADDMAQQRAAEEARRKAASQARVSRWADTTEARQAAFLRAREEEKEEAERRKRTLDELYAQQREEERLAKVAALELRHLKEDPRSRNAASAKMLHDAIKARDEQVAFQESLRVAQSIEDEQERNAMLMDQWGYTVEELQKRMAARERNMAEKNYNLQTVLFQIQERKGQRTEAKAEGVQARLDAAEEARENAAEEAEQRERELETGLFNRSIARPQLSKSGKLQARVQANVQDEAEHLAQEAHLNRMKQDALNRQQRKQAQFEERKRAGLELYAAEKATDSPKHRTQDRFEERGVNFMNKMADEDTDRVLHSKTTRQQQVEEEKAAAAFEAANAMGGVSRKNYAKAEATANGFTSMQEEKAYLAEMRALPEKMRRAEADEEAARLAEAKRIESIQKMQAAEKRERARREVEHERENIRRQHDYQAGEDAKFHAFIESQLPADMHPVLRAKAMQLE